MVDFVRLREWFEDVENRGIAIGTAVAGALVTAVLFLGVMGIIQIFSERPGEGATRYSTSYQASSTVKYPAVPSKPKVKPVYDPPCAAGSDAHGCNDRIYGKRLLEGTIDVVKFNGDEPTVTGNEDSPDRHLQPDYTEILFLAGNDEQRAETINVCGNQLEHFNPGQHVKRIIKESILADYDGCYTLYMNVLTFGGKNAR